MIIDVVYAWRCFVFLCQNFVILSCVWRLFVNLRCVFSLFRHSAWRLFVISSFRVACFRYFVVSRCVISLFRLFAWRYFVISLFCVALFRGKKTKDEMAQISHHTKPIHISSVYTPPNSSVQWLNDFSLQVENAASQNDEIYLLGDFNINLLSDETQIDYGLIHLKHLTFRS